jgi:hypothetical protein
VVSYLRPDTRLSTISSKGIVLKVVLKHKGGRPFMPKGLYLSRSSLRQSNTQWLKKYWLTVDWMHLYHIHIYNRSFKIGSKSINVSTSSTVIYLLLLSSSNSSSSTERKNFSIFSGVSPKGI